MVLRIPYQELMLIMCTIFHSYEAILYTLSMLYYIEFYDDRTKSIIAIFKNGVCYGSSFFIITLPLHQNRLNLSLSLTRTHTFINITFTRQGIRDTTRCSSVPVVMDTRSYPAQVQRS